MCGKSFALSPRSGNAAKSTPRCACCRSAWPICRKTNRAVATPGNGWKRCSIFSRPVRDCLRSWSAFPPARLKEWPAGGASCDRYLHRTGEHERQRTTNRAEGRPAVKFSFADLWRPTGTVDRKTYALVGLLGFAIKHNLDRAVATYGFHRGWGLFSYWVPVRDVVRVTQLPHEEARFLATMVVLSLPFVWVGVVLTIK